MSGFGEQLQEGDDVQSSRYETTLFFPNKQNKNICLHSACVFLRNYARSVLVYESCTEQHGYIQSYVHRKKVFPTRSPVLYNIYFPCYKKSVFWEVANQLIDCAICGLMNQVLQPKLHYIQSECIKTLAKNIYLFKNNKNIRTQYSGVERWRFTSLHTEALILFTLKIVIL